MRRRIVLVLLAGLTIVLSACTGVPSHSAPQVVRTLPIGGSGDAVTPPAPSRGVGPRELVDEFLEANVTDASENISARAFLAPAARSHWSDSTVTIVDSAPRVGLFRPGSSTVVVRGQVIATVDANGTYTPTLQGSDAQAVPFVYGISKVHGAYRINSLRPGLLLTESQFLTFFSQESVYFFDLAHQYLVPDPRWTSLTDPTQKADWLMTQLAGAPEDELKNAVSTDTFPAQANTRSRITVSAGIPAKIEIPGTSELKSTGRDLLATQVAMTLANADEGPSFEITDDGKPVEIPAAGRAVFTSAPFVGSLRPRQPAADVYFLRAGRLIGAGDRQVKGAVNNGKYYLQSVAVSRSKTTDGSLSVAAVAAVGGVPRLLVGSQSGGLHPTSVSGALSRPAYAPGRNEVWVGDGRRIYLVVTGGKTQRVLPVGLPSTAAGGDIVALRLSPEGSRIAVVIRSAGGEQLYVGAVVRGPGLVRVDPLQLVLPEGVAVTDLAWAEPLKLYAIGYSASSQQAHIYNVGVDGSALNVEGIGDLPRPPTSLTVAVGQHAWVTSSASVWRQVVVSTWVSPGRGDQTDGYDPVYLE